MARRTSPALPRIARILAEVGQNIRLARARRKLSAGLVAERAGMSRPTLRAIERGDPGITLGALANVLHALDLAQDLQHIAREDPLGRRLEDAELESKQRVRPPKGAR